VTRATPSRACSLIVLAGAISIIGCRGEIGGGPTLGEPNTDVLSCDELQGLPVPMRRLTKSQYENTIRDLFGDAVIPSDLFPESDTSLPFSSYAKANTMSTLGAEQTLSAAEQVAIQVAADIDAHLPCAAQADRACAEDFVRSLGRRAFRRPVRDEEVTRLLAVFDATTEPDFSIKIAAVLTTMLQMPQFLYLVEEGAAPPDQYSRVPLTSYEVASRLSYLLWNTAPDEALLSAAEEGRLDTQEGVVAEAQRLLSDPERSTPALVRFYREWLGLEDILSKTAKSAATFPSFQAALPAMDEEIDRFIASVLQGDATLRSLLTSEATLVNAELAAFYDVELSAAGEDGWASATVPGRPGILSRAAVMAHYAGLELSSYVKRGKLVRNDLLCDDLPEPPPGASTFAFPPDLTARERSALLSEQPGCASCHHLLDPIGLALESFDAAGAMVEVDSAGEPLDLSGELVDAGDASGPFTGISELSEQLAQSEVVDRCVVGKWFSFQAGRDLSVHDQCTLDDLGVTFAESGDNLMDLVLAIVATDGFRVRRVDLGDMQ
jgi:hypothetical protein